MPSLVRRLGPGAVLLFGLAIWTAGATAQQAVEDGPERSNWAFGITAGTLGLGGEVALRLHPNLVLRGTVSTGDLLQFGGADEITFSTEQLIGLDKPRYAISSVSLLTGGLIADWHPFRDGGRLSAGLRYVDYSISGNVDAATLAVPLGTSFKASNKTQIMPYFGIGYDNALFKNYGLSLSVDAGVMIGDGKHKVTVKGPLPLEAARQEAEISDVLSDVSVIPVFMISGKYRY